MAGALGGSDLPASQSHGLEHLLALESGFDVGLVGPCLPRLVPGLIVFSH